VDKYSTYLNYWFISDGGLDCFDWGGDGEMYYPYESVHILRDLFHHEYHNPYVHSAEFINLI
jgi:hypothetical protein